MLRAISTVALVHILVISSIASQALAAAKKTDEPSTEQFDIPSFCEDKIFLMGNVEKQDFLIDFNPMVLRFKRYMGLDQSCPTRA